MNEKIGSISNYLAGLALLTFGVIYFVKTSFMSYHGEALSMDWRELESSTQILILALMRTVSGGFIAASIAIMVLQRKFSLSKISWIPILILAVGLTVSSATIYATIMVRLNTPGNPPTALTFGGIVMLLAGYIFNIRTLKTLSNTKH